MTVVVPTWQESIRRGYDDLGDHYLDMGDLQNALKAYSRFAA